MSLNNNKVILFYLLNDSLNSLSHWISLFVSASGNKKKNSTIGDRKRCSFRRRHFLSDSPNWWHVHQNLLPLEYASIWASSHRSLRLDSSFDHTCEFLLTLLQIMFYVLGSFQCFSLVPKWFPLCSEYDVSEPKLNL